MPEQYQFPLSPIHITLKLVHPPDDFAPPDAPTIYTDRDLQMMLAPPHSWTADLYPPDDDPYPVYYWARVALDWSVPSTTIEIQGDPWYPYAHPTFYAHITLGPCDESSPWDTKWHQLKTWTPGQIAHARAYRPLSPLAPFLQWFVSSPTVHGTIGDHQVFRGPLYPPGAIYGVTPPDGHGTRLRKRARNVIYTDPSQRTRRDNLAAAAEQWNALTDQQRTDWDAAARTCRPRLTGYALWTQIILTRRLDRIQTLAQRTGKPLEPPNFPT